MLQTSVSFPSNPFLNRVREISKEIAFQPDPAQYEEMMKQVTPHRFMDVINPPVVVTPPNIGTVRQITRTTQADLEEEKLLLDDEMMHELIMSKTERMDVTECLLWAMPGRHRERALPWIQSERGIRIDAKRELYRLEKGYTLSKGESLQSTCDVPGCLNPEHQEILACNKTKQAIQRNKETALKQTTPLHVVQAIHRDMENGMSAYAAGRKHHVSVSVALKIKHGTHVSGLPAIDISEEEKARRGVKPATVLAVKKALAEKKMTMAQIATDLGVSSSFVQSIKYGRQMKRGK